MAKLTAPLLSLDARGTIASTLTFSGWKGVPYARTRVIPANPQTASQTATRTVFKTLGQLWLQMQTLARAPWTATAVGKPMTPQNALLRTNLSPLIGETDMLLFAGSAGALAGIAPATLSAAYDAPSETITATVGAPTLPPGWTIEAAVAIAFPDQDPSDPFVGPVVEAEDTTAPYEVALAAVTLPTGTWIVTAWFRYLRPDGRTAYGPSLSDTVTVT